MARMQILSARERESFNAAPLFDHRDREKFFDFPQPLLSLAKTFRHSSDRIFFLVRVGSGKGRNDTLRNLSSPFSFCLDENPYFFMIKVEAVLFSGPPVLPCQQDVRPPKGAQ